MPLSDRHLLPDDLDRLLDDEEGASLAPLRAHLDGCAGCRAEFDAQRAVVDALEGLPMRAPAPYFTERVMARVDVTVPWHVALRDRVARLAPRSRAGRVVAAATALGTAALMTGGALWAGRRADVVLFVADLAGERLRSGLTSGAHVTVASLVGEEALGLFASHEAVGASLLVLAVMAGAAAVRAMGARRTRGR